MEMNVYEIMQRIPHRYPFLLIDKVTECVPGKSIKALKNITVNEPCFQGHFPGHPVFPGVLIVEAMAQTTGILTFATRSREEAEGLLFVLAGVDNARFKHQVIPGDVLTFTTNVIKQSRNVAKFATEARVGEKLVCSAEILGALTPKGSGG